MAAITAITRTTLASTTDGTSFSTAAQLLLDTRSPYVGVLSFNTGAAPVQPTFSGGGYTWVAVASVTAGSQIRLTVFKRVSGAATNTALVANFGAETQESCIIYPVECLNCVQDEVQSKTATADAATALTTTFDGAFASPWNAALLFIGSDTGTGAFQLSTNDGSLSLYRALATSPVIQVGTEQIRMSVFFIPVNLAAFACTFTSANACAVALELAQDGSDRGGLPHLVGSGLVKAA